MSLSDLRRKPAPSKKVDCNVDEFIESARNYARGVDNIVRLRPVDPPPPAKTPLRKATFTLSESCIEALNQLAEETGLSKSHLVRTLIKQMEQSHTLERQLTVCRYK
jgi:hypothetical protein